MKNKSNIGNGLNAIYRELKDEDKAYGAGGKKIKKARTDVHKKRETSNLKKTWEEHEDDWDEIAEFFGD